MRSARYHLPLLLAACTLVAGCAFNTPILQRGANERTGVLLNYSCGAHPCDAIDPCKPTIVLTHGWNPLPNRIRCTFGPSSAAALKCRCGDSYNILSWDWNAVRVSPFRDEPIRIGKEQGRMMAAALRRRGINPARTQIISHSLGNIAAAQAAVCLSDLGPFAQLTLLDPPESMHEVIFDELCITHHAHCVENYWAPGVAGYGAHVSRAGVQNFIVRGPHPVIGIVDLSRSSHVHVMLWYYNTIRCPSMACGFQNSVFVHCCGQRAQGEQEPPIETADKAGEDFVELERAFDRGAAWRWDELAEAPREVMVR